jgi:UDP-3-O-[3-hydroxymyristoyl] N-acetylglucosamine deacetylase
LPADCFRITCSSNFGHPLAGPQTLDVVVTPSNYARQIAPARTFGFERDLAMMRDMGLIRGATLENAICFGENEILNPGGLRFPDECCRHKILDLIGDFALLGRPLLGHIVADRAGHAMHTTLVRKILSDPDSFQSGSWEEVMPQTAHAAAG